MKNFEKYEKELKEIGFDFGVVDNKPCRCKEIAYCSGCLFENETPCQYAQINWLYEEYVEPPFKPKEYEVYWTYLVKNERAFCVTWMNRTDDISYWKLGNCFRTQEEAETKGKEIIEQIKKEYEES